MDDSWSINTGHARAKMGVNEREPLGKKSLSFAPLDNLYLSECGVRYLCATTKQVALITSNASRPAFQVGAGDLHVIYQKHPPV